MNEEYKYDKTKCLEKLLNKRELSKRLERTRMCISVNLGIQCKYLDKCRFAHSLDELNIAECIFGTACSFVKHIDTENKWINVENEKICCFLHPSETKLNFLDRIDKQAVSQALDDYKRSDISSSPININLQPKKSVYQNELPLTNSMEFNKWFSQPLPTSIKYYNTEDNQNKIRNPKCIENQDVDNNHNQTIELKAPRDMILNMVNIAVKEGRKNIHIIIT